MNNVEHPLPVDERTIFQIGSTTKTLTACALLQEVEAGRLDLDIKVPDLQLLDTLKQSLATAGGLEVEIQSATSDKDQRVQSRLRIQRADT